MDYRQLLIKYIQHIEANESIDYLDEISLDQSRIAGKIEFTKEELDELIKLSDSVGLHYPNFKEKI